MKERFFRNAKIQKLMTLQTPRKVRTNFMLLQVLLKIFKWQYLCAFGTHYFNFGVVTTILALEKKNSWSVMLEGHFRGWATLGTSEFTGLSRACSCAVRTQHLIRPHGQTVCSGTSALQEKCHPRLREKRRQSMYGMVAETSKSTHSTILEGKKGAASILLKSKRTLYTDTKWANVWYAWNKWVVQIPYNEGNV